MLVFRWFLSHLTLFFIIFFSGYLIFNWVKSSDIPHSQQYDNVDKIPHVKPEEIKPEEIKPEEIKPEEIKPEEIKPEEIKPEEIKPEEIKPQIISNIKIAMEKPSDNNSINDLVNLLKSTNHLFKETNNKVNIDKKWLIARGYFNQRNYQKAEKEYLELIELRADFANFYGELSNLYFLTRQISKYNNTLVTLARIHIKNNNVTMARYIIGLLARQSKIMAYNLELELYKKSGKNLN